MAALTPGISGRIGCFRVGEEALCRPSGGVFQGVIENVRFPNKAGAIAGLLQPCTDVLAVVFQFGVRHTETPQGSQRIFGGEVFTGVARRPAAGQQRVARGSADGRGGHGRGETQTGGGEGVECRGDAVTPLEAEVLSSCHVVHVDEDHVGPGGGGLGDDLEVERSGSGHQIKPAVGRQIEIAGADPRDTSIQ